MSCLAKSVCGCDAGGCSCAASSVEVPVEHNANMEGLNATLATLPPFNATGKRSTQLFICIPLYLLQ